MNNSYYRGEAIFSAGGVLVNQETKQILLVYKETSGEWLLPKGHLEDGETIEETAQREIFEETGYKNKVGELLSVQIRPDVVEPEKSKVIFWFKSALENEERIENTQENNENFVGKWVSKEEAMNLLKWEEDKKLVGNAFDLE